MLTWCKRNSFQSWVVWIKSLLFLRWVATPTTTELSSLCFLLCVVDLLQIALAQAWFSGSKLCLFDLQFYSLFVVLCFCPQFSKSNSVMNELELFRYLCMWLFPDVMLLMFLQSKFRSSLDMFALCVCTLGAGWQRKPVLWDADWNTTGWRRWRSSTFLARRSPRAIPAFSTGYAGAHMHTETPGQSLFIQN